MLSSKISYYIAIGVFFIIFNGCTKNEPSAVQKDSFIKSFGGAYQDHAIDIIKDNGNYYILGNISDDEDKTKIFLAKADEFGNRVWSKDLTYTVDDKQTIAGQIIKLEKQPGFAIIGAIEVDDSLLYFDSYLLIIDENGELISETIYDNAAYDDYGKCIAELENGGFVISTLSVPKVGSGNYINIITVSSNGDFILKSSPIAASELFQICKKSNNDGFYVTAYSIIPSKYPFIILINAEGKYDASQKYGIIKGQIRGIAQDKSGNTFVCGKLDNGTIGSNDGFIAKLTDVEESNDYDWLKEFGNSGIDYLEDLVITENNEILVTGSTQNKTLETYDIWVLKTDIVGNYLSETIIGGDNDEYGIKILETDNEKYLVEGTTYFEKNSMISIFKSELK